jgi:hypothetical protein
VRVIAPRTFVYWNAADGSRGVRADGITVTPTTTRENSVDPEPVFTISAPGMISVRLVQTATSADIGNSIGIGTVNKGERPMAIVQSWGGGAHCCMKVTAAVPVGKVFRKVDLGDWDGDSLPWPKDVSGDGIGDFVMVDNAFLYAFGCYACSYAPPQIINIRKARRVDVSTERQFRPLFEADLKKLHPLCAKGDIAACAAFAADAARLGRFAAEWPFVLKSYDRGDRSYPETLRAFLRKNGYIR